VNVRKIRHRFPGFDINHLECRMKKNLYPITILLALLIGCQQQERSVLTAVAEKPPMGWNSFDAYDCAISEAQYRDVVNWLADNLLEYGWEYAVIDYIWWHPEPGNWDTPRRFGRPNIRYNEDGSPLHPEYTTIFGTTGRRCCTCLICSTLGRHGFKRITGPTPICCRSGTSPSTAVRTVRIVCPALPGRSMSRT
jgi:hypothetical protein